MVSRNLHRAADEAIWIEPSSVDEAVRTLADAWARGVATAVADPTRTHESPRDVTLVSIKRLNRIIRVDRENGVVVAESGTSIESIRSAADAVGLWCPALRWLPGQASIGAAVAGGHGRRARRYGTVTDYLLGCRFVCPGAELVRHGGMAIKNATGYNLSAVVAGSRGTMGVLVEVNLRLVPKPASRLIRRVRFSSRDAGIKATRSLSEIALGVDALEVAGRLDGDGVLLVLEVEDAAATVAENRLNRLLARSIDLGGIVEDHTAWPPSLAATDCLTRRTAVSPREFADNCVRIATLAQERGTNGWILAEATGGALELASHADSAANLDQILSAAGVGDQSPSTTGLRAAIKSAFDPNGLLRAF